MKVEIRGFQSIDALEVEVDGFTALVGKSNIGKSALVRALKTALTNPLGMSFVRHSPQECARILRGMKTCKCTAYVRIVAEGFDLQWEKGDPVNRYVFNEKLYDKPGVGIPEFLVTAGLGPVRVGDHVGVVQVADQFVPIFMLNQSGPAIAEAISDVSRLDRINAATRLVEKDRREVIATKKVREKDLAALQVKLDGYQGLDAAIEQVRTIQKASEALTDQREKAATLDHYCEDTQALVARIKVLWDVSSLAVPNVSAVETQGSTLVTLDRFTNLLQRRVEGFRALAWVEPFLRKVPEVAPVVASNETLQRLEGWVTKLRSYRERYLNLEGVGAISVPPIEPVAQVQDRLRVLTGLAARYATITKGIQTLEHDLEQTSTEEAAVVAEVDDLGICPTCVQPVISTRRHAHA